MPDLTVSGCKIIELPVVRDHRGNLTVIEASEHVPFDVRRVYYLYDIPAGANRAGHAHKSLEQLLVAVSGSFDVVLDDGVRRQVTTLNRPFLGLYLPRLVWREIENFSSGAVCLALASAPFDEEDYIREYETFVTAAVAR